MRPLSTASTYGIMPLQPNIRFSTLDVPGDGILVVLSGQDLRLTPAAARLESASQGLITAAARGARFTGKALTGLDLLLPRGLTLDRLIVAGAGRMEEMKPEDWMKLGGSVMGRLQAIEGRATVVLELPEGRLDPRSMADFATGMMLRAYRFDRYKTKKKEDEDLRGPREVVLAVAEPAAAEAAFAQRLPAVEGTLAARDLVNEPANVLGPVEFAERARMLEELGVAVEVLDEGALRDIGMRALLGVSQGSVRPPRVVVMRWNGTGEDEPPLCFIGKGVVFDTGGISIKPAQGMEEMKGDMAGAAAVVGLMHALAKRRARAHVVGLIGLVENMPDGAAQRPGDIVASLSGQTIEVINTDAEGRLVLADLVCYAQERFRPRFIVDLATLTGAVIVALGHEHAGLFSNNDELSQRLLAAGLATGEKLWRLPLAPEYDKLIDSKVADVKNTGGRFAGAITGAQFIQRFVKDTPWAHLDIAGAAMGSPQTETNKSWSSGFGVRLLDCLVMDHYEAMARPA